MTKAAACKINLTKGSRACVKQNLIRFVRLLKQFCCIDEDGEPPMDPQPEPDDDVGKGGDWTHDRSPALVHGGDGRGGGGDDDGLEDWGLEGADADAGATVMAAAKKGKGSSALRDLARGGLGKEKKRRREDDGRDMGMSREKRGFSGGRASGGGVGHRDHGEREIHELSDTIAGGDSEFMHFCDDGRSPITGGDADGSHVAGNGDNSPARPLRFVYCDENGKLMMDPEAVAALQLVKGPVGVVSVFGRVGQGKSSVLN